MENSKIEWTDHTFNPWWGCTKVSAGCKNCYAETLDNRWKGGHWGPGSERKAMSEKYWSQPVKWNEIAKKDGKRARVFCASMGDVFEGHTDTIRHLMRLLDLIKCTPYLDWLLLTKRPENIMRLTAIWWVNGEVFPDNVWIGTSVENQEQADIRIPHLLKVPAKVRFLSMEPLLGPVDLQNHFYMPDPTGSPADIIPVGGIDWVIVGGESGHGARLMHPYWVRSLRDQCAILNVPFFFKQWGEWLPFYDRDVDDPDWRYLPKQSPSVQFISITGGSGFHGEHVVYLKKVGKKEAGRLLDDREWDELPVYV